MLLGIDASNIRAGGGVTHLAELLRAADPLVHGFSRVLVWSGRSTLDRIEDRPWLEKRQEKALDRGLLGRSLWQRVRLAESARAAACDVLFVPGGSYAGDFHPIVTMSQNLLPFQWRELRRFGLSWMTLKFALLRFVQSSTFRSADGLIFLTAYARDAVLRVIGRTSAMTTVVPHGIDRRFFSAPRKQEAIAAYSFERPFRILYVSIIDVYKHQWYAAEAAVRLRSSGLPVVLELVGPASAPALRRLQKTLRRVDPHGEAVRYSGPVPYESLHNRYVESDLCLFASSCEAFGQIVTEAMAAGVPIACSNRSAMPEVLGSAGTYFDPEDPEDIARALRELIESPELRTSRAQASYEGASRYSWGTCADHTFAFLRAVAGLPPRPEQA